MYMYMYNAQCTHLMLCMHVLVNRVFTMDWISYLQAFVTILLSSLVYSFFATIFVALLDLIACIHVHELNWKFFNYCYLIIGLVSSNVQLFQRPVSILLLCVYSYKLCVSLSPDFYYHPYTCIFNTLVSLKLTALYLVIFEREDLATPSI